MTGSAAGAVDVTGVIPHLLLPAPWPSSRLVLAAEQRHHLDRVLRVRVGEAVTYTDGVGVFGEGLVTAEGEVARGPERVLDPPAPQLTVAVAPPASRQRLRFLVEKLVELEVARIEWLATRRGEGRPPPAEKARAWAVGALEQCKGTRLPGIGERLVPLAGLDEPVVAAVPGGGSISGLSRLTIAVGPEGGWAPGELAAGVPTVGLGRTVLRVETAALVAAVIVRAR